MATASFLYAWAVVLDMALDGRDLLKIISIIFSTTMALLVLLGSVVMMYGNFELGVILFVLGLVLVISNEGILPRLRRQSMQAGLIEEIANLAAVGYTPPILIATYLYFSGQSDFKLVLFMALTFTVVTMKIIAKVAAVRLSAPMNGGEEVYAYHPPAEEDYSGPGV